MELSESQGLHLSKDWFLNEKDHKLVMKERAVQTGVNINIVCWEQQLGILESSNKESELGSNERCHSN